MIDNLRHLSEFSPTFIPHKRVDVIGAGATGSRIALSLAKLGVPDLHVWDFDTIESHNVPNQVFGNNHVGELKVVALKKIIEDATGTIITEHAERVDGSQALGNVVFLLTDTMASRKEIWERAIRLNLQVDAMIETRMGIDNGRVYFVRPTNIKHIKEWEETLCSDDIAEVSACGSTISVGPTAEVISGLAVWQFIQWAQQNVGKEVEIDNEVIFAVRPPAFLQRTF